MLILYLVQNLSTNNLRERRVTWRKRMIKCWRLLGSLQWNVIFFRIAFAKLEKISLQYQDLITKESDISIRRQCELLSINRSSIYYVPVEADRERLLLQEKLMERIDYWHTTMPYLGSRKITKLLIHEGFKVCRKTVRRLLERMSITAIYPKKNLSKRNFKEAIVPYLLRNYKVTASNQVWSIDITYIKMHHGHMYLTAIIDW